MKAGPKAAPKQDSMIASTPLDYMCKEVGVTVCDNDCIVWFEVVEDRAFD